VFCNIRGRVARRADNVKNGVLLFLYSRKMRAAKNTKSARDVGAVLFVFGIKLIFMYVRSAARFYYFRSQFLILGVLN